MNEILIYIIVILLGGIAAGVSAIHAELRKANELRHK